MPRPACRHPLPPAPLRRIELLQGTDGVHATSWLDKRPSHHACVASRLETAARVDLRRIPVPGRRPRIRAGVARIPRRHGHHQRMVVVDAFPVPVRGRGLAVDGEPAAYVLEDDGIGRRVLRPLRRSVGRNRAEYDVMTARRSRNPEGLRTPFPGGLTYGGRRARCRERQQAHVS